MTRVTAYTGGKHQPSARFRVRQYIPYLRQQGIVVIERYAGLGTYPPARRWLRPFWAAGSLCNRLPGVVSSYRSDLTLLQREMLSSLITLEPLLKRPRILDVDDAIWLQRSGEFARRLAGLCDAVICGNRYLADYYSRFNPKVSILPTPVNTDRFKPLYGHAPGSPVIGWSGSSSGFPYLDAIEPALAAVLQKIPGARLRVVADYRPRLDAIPPKQFEFLKWSQENEVRAVQEMTVGLMPLPDTPWTRGKCSYKMLTYMACGVPVVVSPVGMNVDVLAHGRIGFGPVTRDEWVDALVWLCTNPSTAEQMGKEGREIVRRYYSVFVTAPQLATILTGLVARK